MNISSLRQMIFSGRFPQASVMELGEGFDHQKMAAELVSAFFCAAKCEGACPECQDLESDDLMVLETSQATIKLEEAAELQSFLSYQPSSKHQTRVAVIIYGEKLSLAAANRLLKTFEELPDFARIVMTCSKWGMIPVTLRSRCVRWKFKRPIDLSDQNFLSSEEESLLEEILLAKGSGEKIENLIDRFGMSSEEICRKAELTLARVYRNPQKLAAVNFARRLSYRSTLQTLHRLAVKSKIKLNAQMAAENL